MTPPDKSQNAPAGRAVAGYLRCSDHDLPMSLRAVPAAGGTPAETPAGAPLSQGNDRTAALDDWRMMRRAELVADAAATGETITAWYEDFAVSGTGAATARRIGFRKLQQDVQAGLLRSVYTRDLSRVFRDLLQQELWFADMERRGVTVHAQDLALDPAAGGDADTRRLLRQQVGAVHEYYSRRLGALWQAARMQSFEEGRWVGRAASCWGLRYDPSTGGFQADAETAGRAIFVFETFVSCAGIACRASARLNALHAAGWPRATLAPTGTSWKTNLVLSVVRSCLYRRRTTLAGAEREAPDLIPPVIPAELLAQADALLAARQPYYDRCRRNCEAPRREYTLRGLIRCRACAAAMQAVRDSSRYPRGASMWASWECPDAVRTKVCKANLSVPQGRALALVCRGVRQALEDYGMSHPWVYGASWATATDWLSGEEQVVRREVRRCRRAEAKYRSTRAACLQAYAEGTITDAAALRASLEVLDRESALWQEARQRFTPPEAGPDPDVGLGGPVAYGRWRRRWQRLTEEELCGAGNIFNPLHPELRAFLQALGASVGAEMGDRPPKLTDKKGGTRRHGGLLSVVLALPRLDYRITLTENQEDLRSYRQWRSERIKEGKVVTVRGG